MKSLERRFKIRAENDPHHYSIVHFNGAVLGQNFSRKIILYWFNKLVDPDDYDKKDKKALIEDLLVKTKPVEAGIKSGVTHAWRAFIIKSNTNHHARTI